VVQFARFEMKIPADYVVSFPPCSSFVDIVRGEASFQDGSRVNTRVTRDKNVALSFILSCFIILQFLNCSLYLS
jgi:hypothetical protein